MTARNAFLSHAAFDRPLAELLATELEGLDRELQLFVASRAGDIRAGRKWLDEIEAGLKTEGPLIVLVTPNSVGRPWLWFEVGASWFGDKQILPVVAGLEKSMVPEPLGSRQVLALGDAADAAQLFKQLGADYPGDIREFVTRVAEAYRRCPQPPDARIAEDQRRMVRESIAGLTIAEKYALEQLAVVGRLTDRQIVRDVGAKGLGQFGSLFGVIADKTPLLERTVPSRQPGEHVTGYTGTWELNRALADAVRCELFALKEETE